MYKQTQPLYSRIPGLLQYQYINEIAWT